MFSRVSPILRTTKLLNRGNLSLQSVRNSSHEWYYRVNCRRVPKHEKIADITMGFAWWWILWHLITEPGHVFGEFPFPEPADWTNAELGIPDN